MKAKSKSQQRIIALSKMLPKLNKHQTEYPQKYHPNYYYRKSKYNRVCLECAHKWRVKTEDEKIKKCPSCKKKIESIAYLSRGVASSTSEYGLVTVFKGHQLFRVFETKKIYELGEKSRYYLDDLYQHWIDEKGKLSTISCGANVMGAYRGGSLFNTNTPLEFRSNTHSYRMRVGGQPYIQYPKKKLVPAITQNGFDEEYHGFDPHELFAGLISGGPFETLFKMGRHDILQYLFREGSGAFQLRKHWPSIKIALRHKYELNDLYTWFDHLKYLRKFKKDVRNPHYICPKDLDAAHQVYIEKQRKIDKIIQDAKDEEERIAEAKKMKKNASLYKKQKGKYFDISFGSKKITIEPLKSVKEFKEIAESLRHCIYAGEYYSKKNSLILVAKIKEEPIETIELCLRDFTVLQSRGLSNVRTKHNKEIVQLVNNNINQIKQIAI